MRKGTQHTAATLAVLRDKKLGIPMSEATKKKIGDSLRGKPKSESHKAAALAARVGVGGWKLSTKTRALMSARKKADGVKPPVFIKEGKRFWKDDPSGYVALHTWVRKTFGTPNECESCGKVKTGKSIHWANVSGNYTREREDWERLCASCHRRKDIKNLIPLPC